MGFISLRCPTCGANLELDETREFGFCNYCGTKVMQEKTIVEHQGKISVEGIADEKAILDRGYLSLEDGDFEAAFRYFDKALDVNPKCSMAYLGKLLCQVRARSIKELIVKTDKELDKYDLFIKAQRFASPKEKEELAELEKSVSIHVAQLEDDYKKTISNSEANLEKLDHELEELKKRTKKNNAQKIMLVACAIVVGAIAAILLIGALIENVTGLWITFALFALGLLLLIWRVSKTNAKKKEYEQMKAMVQKEQVNIESFKTKYKDWQNARAERTDSQKTIYENSKKQETERTSKPLNNVVLIRTKKHRFGNEPIHIYIDNSLYAQAPKDGSFEINLSIGTHTLFFKSGTQRSLLIPISINDFSRYSIKYRLSWIGFKTEVTKISG